MNLLKLLVLAVIIATGCFALVMVWPHRALAQDTCVDVEEDKALAEKAGIVWLGVYEWPPPLEVPEGNAAVFYQHNGLMFLSPVINGCVQRQIFPVAPLGPRVVAPKGEPA